MHKHTNAEPEKGRTDWAAIQGHYRAGVLSIRQIAKQHGVTDTAIRKKAKAESWQRDLAEQVQKQVSSDLVRAQVRTPHARADEVRTDRDIINTAAAMVVAVVREHRTHIATGRGIVRVLMGQLVQAAGSRADLEAEVMALSEDELKGQSRAALQKALSLASHAATVRDLSNAMKNLIGLERQAFGADAMPPPEPVRHELDAVDVKYRMLKEKMDERLGRAA